MEEEKVKKLSQITFAAASISSILHIRVSFED
jgi:hypothetical protein